MEVGLLYKLNLKYWNITVVHKKVVSREHAIIFEKFGHLFPPPSQCWTSQKRNKYGEAQHILLTSLYTFILRFS